MQILSNKKEGRYLLAKIIFKYSDQENDSLNDINLTHQVCKENFNYLSNLISSSLMSVNKNTDNLIFESTLLITLSLFKIYKYIFF